MGPAAIEQAAEFLAGCARLLRHAVTASCVVQSDDACVLTREERDAVVGWRHTLRRQRRAMVRAATLIASRTISTPAGNARSRRRSYSLAKKMLLQNDSLMQLLR